MQSPGNRAMPSKCALKHSLASFTEAAAGLSVTGLSGELTLCCYAEKSEEGSQTQDRDRQGWRGASIQEPACQILSHKICYLDPLVHQKKGKGKNW